MSDELSNEAAEFLRVKALLQGQDVADRVLLSRIVDGYYMELPCNGGMYRCGVVKNDTLRRMTMDMVNILEQK